MQNLNVDLFKLQVNDYLPILGAIVTEVEPQRYGASKRSIRNVRYTLSDGRILLAHDASLLYRDPQGRLKVILQRPRILRAVEVIRPQAQSDSKET